MSSTYKSSNPTDPSKRLHHYVVHEVGPRWFEPVDKNNFPSKSGVYRLKVMRSVRTRYYLADGSNNVSAIAESEVEGLRRTVKESPQTTVHVLRNGDRMFKHVIISHLGSDKTFSGQMTIHANGHVSLTGYRGGAF